MKKVLSIVLSLVMLLSVTSGIGFSAYAEYENFTDYQSEWNQDDHFDWNLYCQGTATLRNGKEVFFTCEPSFNNNNNLLVYFYGIGILDNDAKIALLGHSYSSEGCLVEKIYAEACEVAGEEIQIEMVFLNGVTKIDGAFADNGGFWPLYIASVTEITPPSFPAGDYIRQLQFLELSCLEKIGDCNVSVDYKDEGDYYGLYNYIHTYKATVLDGVSEITHEFWGMQFFSEIVLPESVTKIGDLAFSYISERNPYDSSYEAYEASKTTVTILNPDCEIDESAFCDFRSSSGDYSNTKLCGYSGSTAEQYANEHNMTFIALEPEHTHTWGEWVYNDDAVEEKNGTQTRTCTECGESETEEAPNTAKLKRSGNALALEDSVALKTYVDKATVDYYDEVYAEFERNGKVTKAALSKDTLTFDDTEYAVFDFSSIAPQAMDDEINITIYGVKDGVTYNGESYKYSVTEYIDRTLESTEDEKLKTMLVDLLYYGAECQIYSGYKTDSLMTNILTEEEKAYKSEDALDLTNIKDSSYATCENRLVRFGTALRLNNSVEIATALNISGITVDDLTFKVKAGDREEQTFTKAENPNNFEFTNGYWYFYYDELFADQFSDEVYITAYYNDEPVSYTLKYSVESYAATVKDAALKKVTDAMMHYGNSAKAYANKEA